MGSSNKIDVTESIEIQITNTAPNTENSYEWTAFVWANLTFSGDPIFELISAQPTVEVSTPVLVTFIIRNGDTVLYNGSVALPASGTVSIIDSDNVAHNVSTRSVLAILKNIDDGSSNFAISNLQYYSSFSSFYIKCILPNAGSELCDNWQYAVGSVTPFSSVDATVLSGGETVGIYFGNSHQVVLATNAIITGSSLNATAQKYDYVNNTWNPLTSISVGVTLPNPADPWSPIVISTHPVDALGNASITITGVNTYTLGIAEDFYFPSYTVTVSPAPTSGGASSTGGGISSPTFNVQNAVTYLKSAQNADGSFGNSILYTDWAAIALGALSVTNDSKDKLLTYLNSHNTISSLLTDNERHAMALLSLNQNPYSFNGGNYIDAITDTFDGTQFGDVNLINDDIFALIPLANAGYTSSDEIIIKDITFLISKQKTNGSWEESVDITAATIQALKSFETITGVTGALMSATNYLAIEQKNDGGWSSVYSTSWAMQAMGALNASWTKGGHIPIDYLGLQQTNDGAVSPASETIQNRIWATSYAIAASSLKPWSTIMQSFPKSVIQNEQSDIVTPEIKETNLAIATTPVINEKPKTSLALPNKTPKISSNLAINTNTPEITPEVMPETLVATASNTLPTEKIPHNTTSIVLGVLSGTTLLFIIFKLLLIIL